MFFGAKSFPGPRCRRSLRCLQNSLIITQSLLALGGNLDASLVSPCTLVPCLTLFSKHLAPCSKRTVTRPLYSDELENVKEMCKETDILTFDICHFACT